MHTVPPSELPVRPLRLVPGLLLLAACRLAPPTEEIMPIVVLNDPPGAESLWILLPGIGDRLTDFAKHGLAEPVSRLDLPWKLVATDAHLGYYREQSLGHQLDGLVASQAAAGQQVVLAGISLGGMGSLGYYCRNRDPRITGIVLLAPFLGEEDLLNEIRQAGGPKRWQPGTRGRGIEREIWTCLAGWSADDPWLLLAYGTRDRLAEGHRLLADLLGPDRVIIGGGGHNWSTWERLWIDILHRLGSCDARSLQPSCPPPG